MGVHGQQHGKVRQQHGKVGQQHGNVRQQHGKVRQQHGAAAWESETATWAYMGCGASAQGHAPTWAHLRKCIPDTGSRTVHGRQHGELVRDDVIVVVTDVYDDGAFSACVPDFDASPDGRRGVGEHNGMQLRV